MQTIPPLGACLLHSRAKQERCRRQSLKRCSVVLLVGWGTVDKDLMGCPSAGNGFVLFLQESPAKSEVVEREPVQRVLVT